MSTELPPQPHEVRIYDAQRLLGYSSPASVRKRLELGGITARKIGRDLWFDTRSIEQYLAEKKVGRPFEEAPTKKRLSADERARLKMREYQRERRERIKKEAAKKSRGGKASKKSAAGKSGRAAAKSKGRK